MEKNPLLSKRSKTTWAHLIQTTLNGELTTNFSKESQKEMNRP